MTEKRKNFIWSVFIWVTSIIASAIGNYVTHKDIVGGVILVFVLIFLPFLIEYIRKNDPISYYGLDFESLKKINLKQVFAWAISIFVIISLIDHFVFDLWNIILKDKSFSVGSTSTALAKTDYFYLAVVVLFSGTFLEEIWFRGIVQHKLSRLKVIKSLNPYFAIFVQSILFGLVHFVPIYYGTDFSTGLKVWFFVYPTIIGLIIGFLNDKYNSLFPGWIIHYSNNLLSVFLLTILFRV